MTRWAGRALLAVAVVAVLSACRLDLDVQVAVDDDGSGSVAVVATVDAAALERIGGDLGAVLALDALQGEGWLIEGPTALPDGGATVRASQRFEDPAGAAAVFDELAGVGGPFRDLAVTRSQSLFTTTWGFRGTVDLGRDAPLPAVTPGFDGTQPGTFDELGRELGDALGRLIRFRVGVRLPGDVRSNATTKADNGAVWQVGFGREPLELEASGRRTRTGVVAAAVLLALAVLVGLVALLVRLAGRAATPERATARR